MYSICCHMALVLYIIFSICDCFYPFFFYIFLIWYWNARPKWSRGRHQKAPGLRGVSGNKRRACVRARVCVCRLKITLNWNLLLAYSPVNRSGSPQGFWQIQMSHSSWIQYKTCTLHESTRRKNFTNIHSLLWLSVSYIGRVVRQLPILREREREREGPGDALTRSFNTMFDQRPYIHNSLWFDVNNIVDLDLIDVEAKWIFVRPASSPWFRFSRSEMLKSELKWHFCP